ncbi:MAG: hypothetical protein ACRDRR_07450 [Pseudonocardiaceae bacterium]
MEAVGTERGIDHVTSSRWVRLVHSVVARRCAARLEENIVALAVKLSSDELRDLTSASSYT